MAEIKDGKYKVHNGSDFDTIHLETKGSQVKMDDNTTAQNLKDDFDNLAKVTVQRIDFELKSHLTKTANKHIYSSGTNGFGSYIVFEDGTLICWQIFNSSLKPNQASGSIFRSSTGTLTFPATFASTPVINISSVYTGRWAEITATPSETNFTFGVLSSTSSNEGGNIFYIAIGRWK